MTIKDGRYFWKVVISGAIQFPKGRKYCEPDALLSAALDCWKGNEVSLAGFAQLWGWSRCKTRKFLERVGLEIINPNPGRKLGRIRWSEKRQVISNDSDNLQTEKDNLDSKKTISRQVISKDSNDLTPPKRQFEDRSLTTTLYPTDIIQDKNAARPRTSDEAAALSEEEVQQRNARLKAIREALPPSRKPAQRIIAEYKAKAGLWREKK